MTTRYSYCLELDDFDGSQWFRLIEYILTKADTLEVATSITKRTTWRGTHDWQWSPPKSLRPFVQKQFRSAWKYGVQQPFETTYYQFQLAPAIIDFLLSIAGLNQWHANNGLPENPAFYADGENLLWTISHEEVVWLLMTEVEEAFLIDGSTKMNGRHAESTHLTPSQGSQIVT